MALFLECLLLRGWCELPGDDGPSMSELGNRLWLLRLLAYMVKRLSAQGECLGS